VRVGFRRGFDDRHYFEIVAFSSKKETFPQCTKLLHSAKTELEIFYSFETSSPNARTVSYFSFQFLKRFSIQKAACCSRAPFTY